MYGNFPKQLARHHTVRDRAQTMQWTVFKGRICNILPLLGGIIGFSFKIRLLCCASSTWIFRKKISVWTVSSPPIFFIGEYKIKKNTSLVAKGALAYRLQRRTACKIQNGRQGAPKWTTGSGKVFTLRFLGVLSKFR